MDKPDLVYKSAKGKYQAIVDEIIETHKSGQPVLVGTTSIEKSEYISHLLKRKGVPHKVLNAKYHEQEAEIVSRAGELGNITIATNMAGRGTDIKLADGVREVGGLKIIGTERHESRRIDNQLRGRSGRQGDPGESRFYISLEDDLMRIFGSDKLQGVVERLGLKDTEAIESKMVSKSIENAQKKVEGNNFDVRKTLLGYDDVMNKQREIIYKQRSEVLEGMNLKEQIRDMIEYVIDSAVDSHLNNVTQGDYDKEIDALILYLQDIYLPQGSISAKDIKGLESDDIKEKLYDIAIKLYEEKEINIGDEKIREIERVILLRVVDTKWMDHIDSMDHLKQGIGLRAYRQQDPTQAYQIEGSNMFEDMIHSIKVDTVRILFHTKIEVETPQRESVIGSTKTAAVHGQNNQEEQKQQPVRNDIKIGRNDPCPCGSGKKYKSCCGKE